MSLLSEYEELVFKNFQIRRKLHTAYINNLPDKIINNLEYKKAIIQNEIKKIKFAINDKVNSIEKIA